jgi:hypothetical protein
MPISLALDAMQIAEGPVLSRDGPVVTPRYEPAWFFEDIPAELVAHCLRPRRREPLDADAREWLYKQLVAHGHEANGKGQHIMAHAWFECAWCVKDDISRCAPDELALPVPACHMRSLPRARRRFPPRVAATSPPSTCDCGSVSTRWQPGDADQSRSEPIRADQSPSEVSGSH